MNVLGLSCHYHDASAALVVDGRVAAAAAEERFTLQKHDPNFPRLAAEFCLEEAHLKPQELDAIVFYEQPQLKFTRVFASALSGFPLSYGSFRRSMKTWLGEKLWIRNHISRHFDVHPKLVELVPHHASHAAQAFAAGPFDEAAVLTVDAVGEWATTTLARGRFADGSLQMQTLEEIPYPHSLGLVYAAFTGFLGFRVNDGECSTMALAAFGRPTFADQVRRVLRIETDGTYTIDPSFFTFDRLADTPFARKFVDLFGAPRRFNDPLPFRSVAAPEVPISSDHQRYADVAASIQLVLEEALLALCRRLHRLTGLPNLCLAGGVALNCVANNRLLREGPFADIFIPPDPGDGGAAVGAALCGYFSAGGRRAPAGEMQPFVGKAYDAAPDVAMLSHVKPDRWIRHRTIGSTQPAGMNLEVRELDEDRLIDSVVEDIAAGRVVGWHQGRFENGPRALGNRSILLDPSNLTAAARLSRHVKARSPFRPYALSVAEEDAGRAFQSSGPMPRLARWMQTTAGVREEERSRVAAALHVDGTTRPQVCRSSDNPLLHRLLLAYGRRSGLAAVLNTSLNDSGFPLTASPTEALLMFARTDMDVLVVNDTIIRKRYPS